MNRNWWGMNLNQLKEELTTKGLDITGSKPVLVRRLETYDDSYQKRIEALKAKSKPPPSVSPTKTPNPTNTNQKSPASNNQTTPKSTTPTANNQKTPVTAVSSASQKSSTTTTPTATTASADSPGKPDTTPASTMLQPKADKDWWNMSMQELKNECSLRQLSFMGNKYTLVNRLKTYQDFQSSTPAKPAATTPAKTTPSSTTANSTTKTTSTTTPSSVSKSTTPVTTTSKPQTTTTYAAKTLTSPTPTSKAAISSTPSPQQQKTTAATQQSPSAPQQISGNELQNKYQKLTFAQLKIECVNKKLPIHGSKDELIARLMKASEPTFHIPASASNAGTAGKPGPAKITAPSPSVPSLMGSITAPTQNTAGSRFTSPGQSPRPTTPVGQSTRPTTPVSNPRFGSSPSPTRQTAPVRQTTPVQLNRSGWSPVAQQTKSVLTHAKYVQTMPKPSYSKLVQTIPIATPPPAPVVKKPITFVKYTQTLLPSKRNMSIQTIHTTEIERIQPVKNFYVDEHVEYGKKFSSKPMQWEGRDEELPDLSKEYEPKKKKVPTATLR